MGIPDLTVTDGEVSDTAVVDSSSPDGPALEDLTITVVEYAFPAGKRWTETPVAGVAVAADLPGGHRLEAKTDASGKVVFKGIDWTAGAVDVVAAKAGYSVTSRSGLTRTAGLRKLSISKPRTPVAATLSGVASPAGTAQYLTVTSSTGIMGFQKKQMNYAVKVEAGKPSTLVGLLWKDPKTDYAKNTFSQDLLAWATADWDGKGPTTVNLDFSKPMKATKFSGTMTLAAPSSNPKGYRPYVTVRDIYSGGAMFFLGVISKSTFSKNTFSYEGEYVVSKAAMKPVTHYSLSLYGGSAYGGSFIFRNGYPKDQDTIKGFIAQPALINPAVPTNPLNLSAKFEWKSSAATELVHVIFYDDSRVVWNAWVPAGTSSINLPKLPSGIAPVNQLGTKPLTGRVNLCAEYNWQDMYCRRGSQSRPFAVAPKF